MEENAKKLKGKKSGRNRSKNRAKTEEKQSSAKFRRLKKASTKSALCCKTIPQHFGVLCENFRSCEGKFGTRVPLRSIGAPISQLRNGCEKKKKSQPKPHFAGYFAAVKPTFGTRVPFCSIVTLISQLRNGCEMPKRKNSQFSQPKPHSAGSFSTAKPLFGTRVPFQSPVHSFAVAKWAASFEMTAKSPPSFKMAFKLRN